MGGESHEVRREREIDARHQNIRQWAVDDKVIDLININTKKNPADMMMKTISKGKVTNGLLGGSHVKSQKVEKVRRMKQRPISTKRLNEH